MEAQSRARDILRLVEIQFKGGFPFSFFYVARSTYFFCLLSFHVEWSGKLFNLNNRKVVRAIIYA